jgi:hypothetical protein
MSDLLPPGQVLTLDAVFPYAPHALATLAVAIRQAVVRAQVLDHSVNHLRRHLHLPTVLYRSQYPIGSAKPAADSSVVSPGCFVAVAVSVVAILAALTSGRRVPRRICGRYDATRTPPAKTRHLMSPRPVDSSVGVPRMKPHVRHPQERNSESALLRKRRRWIKGGSAMALQLEVGVRARDLPESVQPYRAHHLVPHMFMLLRRPTLVHRP